MPPNHNQSKAVERDIVLRLRGLANEMAEQGLLGPTLINEAAAEITRLRTPVSEDAVERVARAICHQAAIDGGFSDPAADSITDSMWQKFEAQARAALSTLPASPELDRLREALVQAAVPLEALMLCKSASAVDLTDHSWA